MANSEKAMKDPELAKSAKSLAAHQERLLQGQPWNTMTALVRLSSAPKHSQGGAWQCAKRCTHRCRTQIGDVHTSVRHSHEGEKMGARLWVGRGLKSQDSNRQELSTTGTPSTAAEASACAGRESPLQELQELKCFLGSLSLAPFLDAPLSSALDAGQRSTPRRRVHTLWVSRGSTYPSTYPSAPLDPSTPRLPLEPPRRCKRVGVTLDTLDVTLDVYPSTNPR